MLFYGSGDAVLAPECLVRRRLERGFELISGLQQPLMSTMRKPKDWDEEHEDGWAEVRAIVRDIAMALIGEEIAFKGEPEDPPKWDIDRPPRRKRRRRHE